MPTIYEYLDFLIRLYTEDHLPIHVHIFKTERESKCELHYIKGELVLKWKNVSGAKPLNSKEKKIVEELIGKYHLQIVKKWELIQIFGKTVKKEKIYKL